MKPNIIFVLSLLLILEKQAAVMGQKGGSKGQLPSGSSQFPHRQKGQYYSGQKDKQHTESKGSFSIQHTYHVDANDHDRTQKSQQYDLNAQHKTTKSEQHLRGSQELLNYKQEGRDRAKPKGHFHLIVIHHKGGQVHHGTQNPSQDQGNSPSGKGLSSQYSNTEERLRVSQSSIYRQTEEKAHGKSQKQITIPSQEQEHSQKANKISYQSSSTEERRLHYGENGVQKDVSQSNIYSQTEEKARGKSQKQITIPSQEQEHNQKANKISYQSSSTEERRLHYGENGVQKDVSQSNIYSQTEEKARGKSQKQITIPSQEQEHSQKANKISYQSSSTEERRLHYGENSVQKDISQSSIYRQTEEKAHGKSQKQITIPSQEQEHSQKANKISYQSSSTEERRLHYGENSVQKDISQSSIYRQTEEKAHGKSQKQITIPSQEQEHSQKANKISYQSSSTEERRLHYGENGVRKDVSQSSICSQTEEKARGKSQKQITIPSQEQEHSQKANKISYQSSSTEERRLHYGENGVQKGVSQSSIHSQTENLVAGKSQIQAPNPKQQSWRGENAKGESGRSTNREQDLLSHEQKVRHQHGSHGVLNVVIIEHEDDSDRHSVQRHNYDRNPLST
ncbi:hypothetical protein H8957_003578 [Semnopithecus entellus]